MKAEELADASAEEEEESSVVSDLSPKPINEE